MKKKHSDERQAISSTPTLLTEVLCVLDFFDRWLSEKGEQSIKRLRINSKKDKWPLEYFRFKTFY